MFTFVPAVFLSIFNPAVDVHGTFNHSLVWDMLFLEVVCLTNCTTECKSLFCVPQAVVSALYLYLQGAGQEKLGIYIKSVVKGGAADVVGYHRERCILAESHNTYDSFCAVCVLKDGRLAAGDQLLSVDGRSLVGLSQER